MTTRHVVVTVRGRLFRSHPGRICPTRVPTAGCRMTDHAIAAGHGSRVLSLTPFIALALAAGAALLFLAVPFGWRFGLWHFRTSFQMLTWAQDLALAASAVAVIGLLFARAALGGRGRLLAGALVVFGLLVIYVPWQWAQIRGPHPPLTAITTDTVTPPPPVPSLPAREP